jgi:hypothetical protein
MTGVEAAGSIPVGRLGKPPVTARLREQARAAPGQNIFVIDPEFDPDGPVPGWAVRGYYPSSTAGVPVGDGWVPNPRYRPGPLTRGWPQPRNHVERALQLVAAGYRPMSVLLAALTAAQVVIPTTPQQPDGIPVVVGEDGADLLTVFSIPDYLPVELPRVVVRVADLLPLLSRVAVVINAGQVPSVRVAGTALADAVTTSPVSPPGTPSRSPSSITPPVNPGRTL